MTRKQFTVAIQRYAKKYIGSKAAGTAETDQFNYVAEALEEYDRFRNIKETFKYIQVDVISPAE